ncbi:MAG: hypothetical protein ACPLW8_04210 [Candidatus Bathyarchaeales archaeon]
MYDRNLTEASKSTLAELCSALTIYKNDFVLAGGWAPYFLTRNYFDHCGSKDIDLVLKPAIMTRYESIRQIIIELGYKETPNPFRFEKKVTSPLDKKEYTINLDFLTEPEAAEQIIPFIKVQEDLTACLIEGSNVVFKFKCENEIEATLPNNGKILVSVYTANIVGALTMKGLALPRLNDKDSYDIYAITGYYKGNPIEASKAYIEYIRKANLTTEERATIRLSLNRINQAFKTVDSYGVHSVSRFVGTNVNADAYTRTSTFIKNVMQTVRL